jgi:hypothetical protein
MAAKIKLFDVAVPNEQNMSSIASARWLRSRFI